MSGSPSWNEEIRWLDTQPEALVAEGNEFLFEADSYGSAFAWIMDQHDQQENEGLPLADYRIIPVRATPNGRDLR